MNSLASTQTILDCQKLTKVFFEGSQAITILSQLDFSLAAKERVAIVGASGSGKSTLLHILGCLDHATEGSIHLLDQPISTYHPGQLNQIRNQYIGFVYQFHHLLPEFTLLENISLPLLIQGKPLHAIRESALNLLEQLGLSQRAEHRPSEVSGGERQRAAIGRAIITKPLFILADEPTGNLDKSTAQQVMKILSGVIQSSLVVVTHDDAVAKQMDRILKLENGRLVPVPQ